MRFNYISTTVSIAIIAKTRDFLFVAQWRPDIMSMKVFLCKGMLKSYGVPTKHRLHFRGKANFRNLRKNYMNYDASLDNCCLLL